MRSLLGLNKLEIIHFYHPPLNKKKKYNLYKKKEIQPIYIDNPDIVKKYNISDLLPEVTNTWIFFWASQKRDYSNKIVYPQPAKAYGSFNNCGLAWVNEKGDVEFRYNNPVPYQYAGIKYPPHLHFVCLQEDKLWNTECSTIILTPQLSMGDIRDILSVKKYIFLCSYQNSYLKKRIPFLKPIQIENGIEDVKDQIESYIQELPYKKNLSKPLTAVPIVVCCCHETCPLPNILRQLSFINIQIYNSKKRDYNSKKNLKAINF